jgi:hypothetical protein
MKKVFTKSLLILGLIAIVAAGCNNNAEKRIAELESRLADVEAKKKEEGKASPTIPVEATPGVANGAEQKPDGPLPVLQFQTTEHDFGTIKEGDVVEHTYSFKNVGEAPLIIQGAQGSCGCTVPDWSKDPIPAGGTGFVKAKFDSNGKQNVQSKTVTVTANTFPKQTVLKFKAMVTPKPTGDQGPLK